MVSSISLTTAVVLGFALSVSAATFDPSAYQMTAPVSVDYTPPFTKPEGGELWLAGYNYTASWYARYWVGKLGDAPVESVELTFFRNPEGTKHSLITSPGFWLARQLTSRLATRA